MSRSIMIVINALHSGGAEKTCIEITRNFLERYEVTVVALLAGGPAERELREIGARVELLRASNPLRTGYALYRLARLLRERKPELVLSFLYFSDLIGSLMARIFAREARIYWNIRNNVLGRRQTGFGSYYAARFCALVSRILPHEVVYCSSVSRLQHEGIGFSPACASVVENSAAAVPFEFAVDARDDFRRGRFEGEFLFLFVGRFDPVKRVDVYIEACGHAYRAFGDGIRFLIAGRGMERSNAELLALLAATGCPDRFAPLGFVTDRQGLYSAADCLIVTSESEGSPNVMYEAIATGLPAIVLATTGTDHIAAESVHRLASRNLDLLVSKMLSTARSATRETNRRGSTRREIVLHPLVTYYRNAVSWC